MVRHLVRLGCKYDAYNNERDTPLMLAIMHNQTDLVEILLKPINMNFNDRHFKKLFEIMFNCGKVRSNIVKLAFQKLKKADDEAIAKLLLETKCPLYFALFLNRVEVIKTMIDNGCSVNSKDPLNGNSPLHVAVACGSLNLVQLLLKHNADVNAINNEGKIPVNRKEVYCSREELEILKILVEKKSLLTSRDKSGRMQILKIFQHGNGSAIKIVLRSNIDLNATDSDRNTVIHYTASNAKADIWPMLIKRDFNPNIQNCYGITPLHFVAFKHDLRAIKLLFEKGANVNNSCVNGVPPLHNLIISHRRPGHFNKDCIQEFLIEQGANIQYVTKNGHTILNALNFSQNFTLLDIVVSHLALIEAQDTMIVKTLHRQINSTDWVKSSLKIYRLKLE
ncbi:serine/threonine-protein phosphatase 6 regulatory ankyrin repeat subunit A-like [Phymastichus coffea]|uniref:serine/threonine-protein phosphatase 6 regulatory ankyrin repeat subunit A-like n=1 Tax=Phymastichus coffea TaxID=108790 RepID=UPI00273A7EC6|nr:serine/threonine-protein phosphatase 6 regulatory ankyrin repeat subunit A-like [Phymastichus coffea]